MAKILAASQSHNSLRQKLDKAVNDKHGNGDEYGTYVNDVFQDKVVHNKAGRANRGKLFASPYTVDASGNPTLGEPKEVEQAYKPISEASRGMVVESATLVSEAGKPAYNAKTKTLNLTIIKPGFNTSKTRFYLPTTLKRDGHIFEGAKMFLNHQTKAEAAARPEGRVQDWGATLTKVHPFSESAGLTGVAKVHNKEFAEQLEALQEAGLLSEMGVSIRAAGMQSEAMVDGTKTNIVESFVACKSVDFVTFPGAGGKVDMLESDTSHWLTFDELTAQMEEADQNDVDTMSIEALAARRPDFVAALKIEVQESVTMEKTLEQLQSELAEANKSLAAEQTKTKALEESTKKAAVQVAVATALAESNLPAASKTKLTTQLAESTDVAAIKPAIESETAYLTSLGVKLGTTVAPVKKVAHMGATTESAEDSTGVTRAKMHKAWVESGMTKEQADVACDRVGA